MMSGLQPPAVFKDLGRCLTLPACSVSLDRCDQRDLLVDLEGVSIWLLPLGVSVVRCWTESPVIAVLGARVVG